MDTLALRIRGPLLRPDLPGLFARVCALLDEHDPAVVLCDVTQCAPDLIALEALARLQLAARRHGCELRLTAVSAEMLALVAFSGLSGVLAEG